MNKTAVQFLYEFVQLKLTDEQQTQFEGLFQQALELERYQIKFFFERGHLYSGCHYGLEEIYTKKYKSEYEKHQDIKNGCTGPK